MREGESELGQIEFETTDGSSVAAPDVALGPASSMKVPALIVALVVGGLLAALIWFSSGGDSSAASDEPVADEPVGEQPDNAEEAEGEVGPEEQEAEAEQESVIPESSRASIALEPHRLPSEFTGVLLVDGELLSSSTGLLGGPSLAPPMFRSVDGESWEELETQAVVDGSENTVGYFWEFLWQVGDAFVVVATGVEDGSQRSFTSADGIEWLEFAADDTDERSPFFFEPVAVADSYTVALSSLGIEGLAQFVEDHTTAVDVGAVCFSQFRTVFGCDGTSEWSVTEETIDSEFDSDAVFACLELLSSPTLDTVLSRFEPGDAIDESFELSISVFQYFPLLLSDGRVAGIDVEVRAGDLAVCDGLAVVGPVDSEEVYVFDPRNNTVERAELEPSLDKLTTELLGHVPTAGPEDIFLFRSGGQIWSLDLSTGKWATLGPNLPGDAVLSDSGRRLYSFDGHDLHIMDLELVDGEITAKETVVFVPLPTDSPFSFIQIATDDRFVFATQESFWLLDVPSGLS